MCYTERVYNVQIFFIHQYVQPCLSKKKYTFYTIKSSLTLAYKNREGIWTRIPVRPEWQVYILPECRHFCLLADKFRLSPLLTNKQMNIGTDMGKNTYIQIVFSIFLILNRHGHECLRIWKLSGNFTLIQCIKKCRDFLGRDISRTTFS